MENLVIDTDSGQNNSTVADFVYFVIKKNILNWNLKPGQRIGEKDVSKHLNISKTPVREAFIRLGKEKLIDILPQRGSFVSKIDLKDVEESLFVRRSLELSVIELAVGVLTDEILSRMKESIRHQQEAIQSGNYDDFLQCDEDFHKAIFFGAGRERTWYVMNEANIQYKRVRMLSLIDIHKCDTLLNEHSKLLAALEKRDLEEARCIVEDHLGKIFFEEEILKKKYPDYFL